MRTKRKGGVKRMTTRRKLHNVIESIIVMCYMIAVLVILEGLV